MLSFDAMLPDPEYPMFTEKHVAVLDHKIRTSFIFPVLHESVLIRGSVTRNIET